MFLSNLNNNPETQDIYENIKSQLSPREYKLLSLIVMHTLDKDRKSAVIPIKTLKENLRLKERIVRKLTKGLVDKGYILEQGNEYTILMENLEDVTYFIELTPKGRKFFQELNDSSMESNTDFSSILNELCPLAITSRN